MRNSFLIVLAAAGIFILEYFLVNILGRLWTPNFSLLFIIFINLVFGVRYGLLTAFAMGMLWDSYSADHFGLNTLAMMASCYLVVLFHKYLSYSGSRQAVLFLTFLILLFDVLWKFFLHSLTGSIHWKEMFYYVFLPEIAVSLIAVPIFYRELRRCVSKLSD